MKISIRTISFAVIIIIIICIVAVIMAFYMQFRGILQGDGDVEKPISITEENKRIS